MVITEPAPAKINLALHVRRRRADGYHDIETLFAFCADGDTVTVAPADTDRFTITGPFAASLTTQTALPRRRPGPSWDRSDAKPRHSPNRREDGASSDNLVIRAARAFTTRFAPQARHAITLDKHLPIASGIGGGSADAAATLRALAKLHDIPADDAALTEIAATLGADVPACLLGRAALGTGKGDSLIPLESLAGTPVLLLNPPAPISTAAVFAAWDGIDRGPIPEGALLDRAAKARNDLELPARAIAPAITDVLAWLAACDGATLTRMSGSGATCFALFGDAAGRDHAAAAVPARWWHLATHLT